MDPQALHTASGHCLQSLTSLCQLGTWPCVFKPTSALSTFSLAINSAELWPKSLFALIFLDTPLSLTSFGRAGNSLPP